MLSLKFTVSSHLHLEEKVQGHRSYCEIKVSHCTHFHKYIHREQTQVPHCLKLLYGKKSSNHDIIKQLQVEYLVFIDSKSENNSSVLRGIFLIIQYIQF